MAYPAAPGTAFQVKRTEFGLVLVACTFDGGPGGPPRDGYTSLPAAGSPPAGPVLKLTHVATHVPYRCPGIRPPM